MRARLFPIAPHASYFPDLLTPPEAALGLDEGIDTILHAPQSRLAAEIGRLDGAPGAAPWLTDLAAGRAGALTALGRLMRAYHWWAIAPYWDRLRDHVHTDLAMRRQIHRDGGIDALLDSFGPIMRWRRPVLELARHPSDRDVHLDGRGLRLVPSYFCQLHSITMFGSDLPQVVVYPVRKDPGWLTTTPTRPDRPALARLLGDVRAAVLRAAVDGCTTTELARRAGTSLASASRHAAVLRNAGLLATRRHGSAVLHTATALGADLVTGRGGQADQNGPRGSGGRSARVSVVR